MVAGRVDLEIISGGKNIWLKGSFPVCTDTRNRCQIEYTPTIPTRRNIGCVNEAPGAIVAVAMVAMVAGRISACSNAGFFNLARKKMTQDGRRRFCLFPTAPESSHAPIVLVGRCAQYYSFQTR